MNLPDPIVTDEFEARIDAESTIMTVTYRCTLSPELTTGFYKWMMGVAQDYPELVTATRGSIFDFRQVTEFVSSNLSTVRRESKKAGQDRDLQNHPVALVVETLMQEKMVGLTMKLTEGQNRKRIVRSMDEAQGFISKWHAERETAE